jgi:hypothetical protein
MAKLEGKVTLAGPQMTVTPVALTLLRLALSELHVGTSSTGIFRQSFRPPFVFRPEVSLGAALRSLAPPSHA